jgi:hypothetical protein
MLLGLVAGLVAFYIFSSLFVFRTAWAAHVWAIGIVIVSVAVALGRSSSTRWAVAFRDFSLGFGIAFFLGIVASVASLALVVTRAKALARDASYCIEVADNRRYKPAAALLDLSGLALWSLSRTQRHAVLIVNDGEDPRYFFWSYRNGNFVPDVINQPLTCIPQRTFVGSLPVAFPPNDKSRYVRFSKHQAFRIPDTYQPRWSGRGEGAAIRLAVTAPDFAPRSTSWDDLPPRERDFNQVSVNWNQNWLLSLISAASDGQPVEQGTEFGLRKTLIISRGRRDSREYRTIRYDIDDSGGSNVTLISCYPATKTFPESCQHRFLSGGRHYYFRHPPEDVVRWQEMQRKVLELFGSFEAGAIAFEAAAKTRLSN